MSDVIKPDEQLSRTARLLVSTFWGVVLGCAAGIVVALTISVIRAIL